MALWSKRGSGSLAMRSSVKTRPTASATATRSEPRRRTSARRRERASSKLSRSELSVPMLLSACERDRVREDGREHTVDREYDGLRAAGERRHDASSVNAGHRAGQHRSRANFVPGQTAEGLAEAVELLLQERV